MTIGKELGALFRRDLIRLGQEVAAFPDDAALWEVVPGVTNPAGNLTLHLEGNLREYIGHLLGSIPYQRDRPLEFAGKDVSQADLAVRVHAIQELIPGVVENLSESVWNADYPEKVFGSTLSTCQFVLHLHGHFNYHLGQIDYLRRVLTGKGALPLAGL